MKKKIVLGIMMLATSGMHTMDSYEGGSSDTMRGRSSGTYSSEPQNLANNPQAPQNIAKLKFMNSIRTINTLTPKEKGLIGKYINTYSRVVNTIIQQLQLELQNTLKAYRKMRENTHHQDKGNIKIYPEKQAYSKGF